MKSFEFKHKEETWLTISIKAYDYNLAVINIEKTGINIKDYNFIEKERTTRTTFWDFYFAKYKWYRKIKKGNWFKHQYTKDALELSSTFQGTWWARYSEINRYSEVVDVESY